MDANHARQRFTFLSEALDGTGGFAPLVAWESQSVSTRDQAGNTIWATRRVPKVASPSHLVPHARESAERYAARCALATYENHLRAACEQFVSYLQRRKPMRDIGGSPLAALLVQDADMGGKPLDAFMASLALELRARGSMLVLMDMPDTERPASMLEQIERRAVPYLRMIRPEDVCAFELDDETGAFRTVTISCMEEVAGKPQQCERTWDMAGWSLRFGERVLARGEHPFGMCPVMHITESGRPYPCVGKYAQIADLSLSLYNARSELSDLMRGQGFGVLAVQVPPEAAHNYDAPGAAATIGVHSMLLYPGEAPRFISPEAAPAQTYLAVIEQLTRSVARVSLADEQDPNGTPESGLARRMRFERLNADLAGFSAQLQALERRIWRMFATALGVQNVVTVEWPTDFNLVDSAAELDILSMMQATGFPQAALAVKRAAIAAAEFDGADEDQKAAVLQAIEEQAQELPAQAPELMPDAEDDAAEPEDDTEDDQPPAPAAAPAPVVQPFPSADELGAAIGQAVGQALAAAPKPDITVNSPVTVNVPEQPAPVVNITQPVINVATPEVVIHNEQQAATPPTVVVNAASGPKQLSLTYDADGRIVGGLSQDAEVPST